MSPAAGGAAVAGRKRELLVVLQLEQLLHGELLVVRQLEQLVLRELLLQELQLGQLVMLVVRQLQVVLLLELLVIEWHPKSW